MCPRRSPRGNRPSARSPITPRGFHCCTASRPSGRRGCARSSMRSPDARAGSPNSAPARRATFLPGPIPDNVRNYSVSLLLRPEPALLGDIEDDPVGVLELQLEIGLFLRFAQGEEKLAARGFDA